MNKYIKKYIKNYFKFLFIIILIGISFLFIMIAFLNMIDPIDSLIFSKLESIIPGIYNSDPSSLSYSIITFIVDNFKFIIESTPRLVDSIILGIAVYTIISTIRDFIPNKEKPIKKNKKILDINNFTLVIIGIIASIYYYLIYLFDNYEVGKAVSDTLALIALGIVIFKYVGRKQKEYLEDRKENFKSLISKLLKIFNIFERMNIMLGFFKGLFEKKENNKINQKFIFPIIDDPQKREYNKPFRKTGDDENIVRIIQKAPKKTPEKVAELVTVEGINKHKKDALKVISSNSYSFRLEKDPNNSYDENAIKVIGISKKYKKEESFLIGYIPNDIAKDISNYNELKPTISVIHYPTSSKPINIILNIWSDRKKFKTIPFDLDSFKRDMDAKTASLGKKTKEQKKKTNYRVTSHIPIIDEPSKREYNTPYRKSSDGNNVARINQKAPKGTQKKVAEFVKVAGISNYQEEVMKVISSDSYSFKLEKDPKDVYDKNAIKVIGDTENNGKKELFLVGYVPRQTAKELSKYEILKATLRVIYFPTSSKSAGLRLDIWSKRNKPKSKKNSGWKIK